MKALIQGTRVAQVVADDATFPVASPMEWVACPDDTTTAHRYVDGAFFAPSPPPEPVITKTTKARIGLFLMRYDTTNSTSLWPTLQAVIASDAEAQWLWDSVPEVEINRGGVPDMWAAVVAQTGTDLTLQEIFDGAAALEI